MYISALEMASQGNQQCASCIGTLALPVVRDDGRCQHAARVDACSQHTN